MIVKNPNGAFNKMRGMIPTWNADGCKTVKAIALSDCTTNKLPGALVLTSSGWGFETYGYFQSTGLEKFGINITAGASGDTIEVAVEGFVSAVSLSGTGTVTTCYSTAIKGYAVMVNATGHLTNIAATWLPAYWTCATANTTANAVVGMWLSSGDDKVVHDIWLVGKADIYPTATA